MGMDSAISALDRTFSESTNVDAILLALARAERGTSLQTGDVKALEAAIRILDDAKAGMNWLRMEKPSISTDSARWLHSLETVRQSSQFRCHSPLEFEGKLESFKSIAAELVTNQHADVQQVKELRSFFNRVLSGLVDRIDDLLADARSTRAGSLWVQAASSS